MNIFRDVIQEDVREVADGEFGGGVTCSSEPDCRAASEEIESEKMAAPEVAAFFSESKCAP